MTLSTTGSLDELRGWRADRLPALLLGGLNLLRPLGMGRVPVIVASSDPREPAFRSRYCNARFMIPSSEERGAWLKALLKLGAHLQQLYGARVPIVYGNDDTLDALQECQRELSPCFRMVLNDPDVAHALIAKDRFAQLARERGIPVPRSLAWDGEGEERLSRYCGPVLVKPRSKVAWEDSPVLMRLLQGKGKALVFQSAQDALQSPLVRQLHDQLSFQEYVPGDDRSIWSFHGYADERGALLAWFIGRKIRTYPALTGVSTYLELAHDDGLAALGHDIVARTPLKGAFKIDLKQDARTGEFRVLEVNARFNLWHYLGAANGINLPRIAYEYLVHGERPARSPAYGTKVRWLYPKGDFQAFRELASRGQLGAARWAGSLLSSPKVYDLFGWSDPGPFFHEWLCRGTSIAQRLRARVRWPSTAS